MKLLGIACVVAALALELLSYWKQIAKTLRTKHSRDVSTTAYLFKIVKYILTMLGLFIYANWVGLVMEIVSLTICIVALYIICLFKPKNWHLF